MIEIVLDADDRLQKLVLGFVADILKFSSKLDRGTG